MAPDRVLLHNNHRCAVVPEPPSRCLLKESLLVTEMGQGFLGRGVGRSVHNLIAAELWHSYDLASRWDADG
jgi:hypothetical protein